MQFKYLKYRGKRHLSIFFAGDEILWCLIRLKFLPRVPSLPALAQICTSMALAVQPGQGQHHFNHHFFSKGRLEESQESLLLIALWCLQSPSSLQPRSHTAPTPHGVCCTAAHGQGLGCGHRRVAHTRHRSLLFCFTHSQTFQHPNTPLPSGSFIPSNLHSSSQPRSLQSAGRLVHPCLQLGPLLSPRD